MADSFFQKMQKTSHLSGQSAAYIESLYEVYLDDPSEVSEYWREYFERLPRVAVSYTHLTLPTKA